MTQRQKTRASSPGTPAEAGAGPDAARDGSGVPDEPADDTPGAEVGRPRRSRVVAAVVLSAAAVAAIAITAVALVGTGGGRVRVEGSVPTGGSAPTASAVPVSPIHSQTPHDLVAMLLGDARVPSSVKQDARLCGDDGKHITAQYADVTKDGATDVVINVASCADNTGTGVFAFTHRNGADRLVFNLSPVAGVHATVDHGDIVVSRIVDPDGRPGGSTKGRTVERVRYSWNGQHFQPLDSVTSKG